MKFSQTERGDQQFFCFFQWEFFISFPLPSDLKNDNSLIRSCGLGNAEKPMNMHLYDTLNRGNMCNFLFLMEMQFEEILKQRYILL